MSEHTEKPSDFVTIEENILQYWQNEDIFTKSLEKNAQGPRFVFYDGPPFATGLPHHGHLLASTIKDIIPRYQTMKGYYVPRRFGWDCHGLPIEHEINKLLEKSTQEIVSQHGLAYYNNECRKIIMRYREKWYETVSRIGRWVDFENDYKTMDASFMESVWWVFSELWKKDLIYRGNKVVAYSTALETPLSNFEAGSNYQTVQDPAITVALSLDDDTDLLIWTTTPWTLPANMGVCVGMDIEYAKIKTKHHPKSLILAKARIDSLFDEYEILSTFQGSTLVGRQYHPLFSYLKSDHPQTHTIFADDFVSIEDGTGLVHLAPAFGEDDQRVMLQAGINDLFCPIDEKGQFDDSMPDWLSGQYVFNANPQIIAHLKQNERLIDWKTIDHSYPHCPRSDTKLIYRAVPSWYVKVTSFKEDLLKNLEQTNWMPPHVKDKRFANWLENARDWAISRNRYWGNPIPLWVNDQTGHTICITSKAELEKLTGQTVDDLHREFIDDLTFTQPDQPGVYRRTPEVLDCWFESGAMPFAQSHYPFTQNTLSEIFPADFIAEGLDQTRGWFYTLHVIATALFNRPAYKQVNVNGIILASDGKKMSKRLKNYTAPDSLMNQYGADPLRLYLINSNLLKAEEMRFSDQGIREMSRKVILPWYNAFSFLNTYATLDQWQKQPQESAPQHVLDRWIISRLQTLKLNIETAMSTYALYTVVPALVAFIDELTNTYIRLNRARFWADGLETDKQEAYATLLTVCHELSLLMAPFCPFMAEHLFQEMKKFIPMQPASVHLCDYPTANTACIDHSLEKACQLMEQVIILGRQCRNNHSIKVKTPLQQLMIIHHNAGTLEILEPLKAIIAKELNVKEVVFESNDEAYLHYQAVPNAQVLGRQFGKAFKTINQAIRSLSHQQICDLLETSNINIDGNSIDLENIFIRPNAHNPDEVYANQHIAIKLDLNLNDNLLMEGLAREFVSSIQKARKDAGLAIDDRIIITYHSKEKQLAFIDQHAEYIKQETLCQQLKAAEYQNDMQCVVLGQQSLDFYIEKSQLFESDDQ